MKRNFTKIAANNNIKPVPLGLALQGGGSYGAFTKGALKALLESPIITDERAEIKAITGTSAGAMNGLMVAHGLNTDGPSRAVQNLDALWEHAGQGMRTMKCLARMFNPLAYPAWKATVWPNFPTSVMDLSLTMMPKGFVTGQLKKALDRQVGDWAPVQDGPVKLFINAVREDEDGTRSHHVFKGRGLTPDAFAAAGSLDALGAHVIDGVKYYDGGYMRNPCFDDIEQEPISDLMIITIMEGAKGGIIPVTQDELRAGHARPGREVMKSELHHHLAWMSENKKNMNLHVVSLQVDERWNDTSRMNTDPAWLRRLEAAGYEAMKAWIEAHADKLGRQSSYQPPLTRDARSPALQCAV